MNEDEYNALAFNLCAEIFDKMVMDPWPGSQVDGHARALDLHDFRTDLEKEMDMLSTDSSSAWGEKQNSSAINEEQEALYVIENSGYSTDDKPQGRRAAIEHTKRKLANE